MTLLKMDTLRLHMRVLYVLSRNNVLVKNEAFLYVLLLLHERSSLEEKITTLCPFFSGIRMHFVVIC